jgi:hypothetical protein
LFGGKDHNNYLNDFYCCDIHECTWYKIESPTTPEPRAWATAFWIQNENLWFFSIFGGASKGAAQRDLWMYDYDRGDWGAILIEGDVPSGRYAHISAVIGKNLYIIGGRSMNNTGMDPYCVNTGVLPFKGSLLPQVDEPEKFEFGAGVVIENFGLALYGGTAPHRTLWKIRLSPQLEMAVTVKPKTFTSGFSCSIFARPNFSPHTEMVSVLIGSPKNTFNFDRVAKVDDLSGISKVADGVHRWRVSSVIAATSEEATSDNDAGALLTEEEFDAQEPPPAAPPPSAPPVSSQPPPLKRPARNERSMTIVAMPVKKLTLPSELTRKGTEITMPPPSELPPATLPISSAPMEAPKSIAPVALKPIAAPAAPEVPEQARPPPCRNIPHSVSHDEVRQPGEFPVLKPVNPKPAPVVETPSEAPNPENMTFAERKRFFQQQQQQLQAAQGPKK